MTAVHDARRCINPSYSQYPLTKKQRTAKASSAVRCFYLYTPVKAQPRNLWFSSTKVSYAAARFSTGMAVLSGFAGAIT